MKAILLSIKPEYVDRILAGTKKYEYRKRLARSNSSVLLVYSTSPVMKVVAKVEILGTGFTNLLRHLCPQAGMVK